MTALMFFALTVNCLAADFSLSAGGGGLAGYTFTRYSLEGGSVKSVQSMDRFDYGGFLFFDATYAEFSLMCKGGNYTYSEKVADSLVNSKGTGSETSIGFSLLGKYPLSLNNKITWFPMFGIDYQIALTQIRQPDGNISYDRSKGELASDRDVDDKPYPLSAWNSLWIEIGAGLDFSINGPLFLRSEFLFGFRLPTVYEMGALEFAKMQMNMDNPKLGGLTGNPSLKVAIGYMF